MSISHKRTVSFLWEWENRPRKGRLFLTIIIQIAMMEPEHREGGIALLITRETDYALRVLRALSAGEAMTAGEIAQAEGVPQQFAYKITKKLERAGLLQITRGVGGGCRLTANLERVTLYELMAVMEEDTRLISCMEPGYRCTRPQDSARCAAHHRLKAIQAVLDEELKGRTLAWLLFGP